ncbi:MAG: hypothetical protein RIQ51_1134 [Bacteroidota bacterium]|jgi:hypothetical protein
MTIEVFLEMVSMPVLILLWASVVVKLLPLWLIIAGLLGIGVRK